MATKVLWVVDYADAAAFLARAQSAGATRVAIRTSNNMDHAIQVFQGSGIEVYGWRWPSAQAAAAMAEANNSAALLQNGLDGYYIDPENGAGAPDDWNQSGLASLAQQFSQTIKATNKPFGITSHMRAQYNAPNLPWQVFFTYADVLLPQSYWRTAGGVVRPGTPDGNYNQGISSWTAAGGDPAKIKPMAGELASVTAAEIATYGATAAAAGNPELHFYADQPGVDPAIYAAIQRL